YKTLAALLWLAPVAMAVRYGQVWDRLPVRMASHFNAAGRVNGWSTRVQSLAYSVAGVAVMTAIFFAVSYAVQAKYPLAKLSWVLLAFFHVQLWTFVFMLNGLIAYNLGGAQLNVTALPIVAVVGIIAIVAVAVSERRGTSLARTEIVAEEVHAGKIWSAVLLLPVLVLAATAMAIPNAVARTTLGIVAGVSLAAFAMAWDGFHYYFTRHGVEIRTLGFRLKSIPALQIKNYEIQNWNPVRGLGIRGIGNHKAYVWGNKGVRVEMYDGEVFLGHSDPQRIVHDLNVVKRYQQS
ncbi:MAG TPA: DUF1648 domain-containing protein, partial [Candidatus Binatia bacterium]|nr:DUF1648 domain-containing protein [Candidatus Binatia bacterium]